MSTPILPLDRLNAEWSPVAAKSDELISEYVRIFRQKCPKTAAKLNGRIEAAAKICHTAGACKRADGYPPYVITVQSQSNPRGWYFVDLKERTCTCPDSGKGNLCKHRLAVGFHVYGPDWLADEHIARIKAENDARAQAINAARQAETAAWQEAINAIDAWEDFATTRRPDGTYPSDDECTELRAIMREACERAESLSNAYYQLADKR